MISEGQIGTESQKKTYAFLNPRDRLFHIW